MINKLYKDFADYYAAVTNDRDFNGQLECILNSYDVQNPCHTFLELFAGQSLHSIEALGKSEIDVWAVDSSMQMKNLALKGGFANPDQYIVGDLPDAILECKGKVKFDCVTCLYHGLSNLSKTGVYELLSNIKELLNEKGKLFLEIHDIYYIMEYISNPVIRFTEVRTSDNEVIKYAWPGGKIKWDHYSCTAEVPIKLIIESSDGSDEVDLISVDHIYSTEDIVFLANLLGYNCTILTSQMLWKKNFGGEIVLELSL